MPTSREDLKKYNRYELREVQPHFGQAIVGIYQTIREAKRALAATDETKRVIIYDTINRERIND